jgi:C-terminal processing protease CtpA/Prc
MTRHFSIFCSAFLLTCGSLRADTTNAALATAVVLENNVAYLRAGEVQTNLAVEIALAQTALASTNKIFGTVLDLRFADGDDLAASRAAADLFAQKKLPLAILVNGKTRGAALALGTALREARDGIVIGGAAAGLKPDIAVPVKLADEKQFIENPYAALTQNGTNVDAAMNGNLATFIDHISEADLVREKIKDGDQDEDSMPPHPTEPQKPYIHDPVLARAVDLIKALAVVRQPHG